MNTHTRVSTLAALLLSTAAYADSASMCVSDMEQVINAGTDASATMSFVLPVGATVTSVAVDLDLDHTWLGDLVIELEHGGTTVTLLERVGINQFPFGCGGRDITATFRDDATASPSDLCVPTTPDPQPEPMIAGDVRPEQMLALFNGSDPSGQWTITITDQAANDSGVVHSACINLEFDVPTPACSGDVNMSGGVDIDDLNALLGVFGTGVGVGSPLDIAGDDGVIDIDDLNLVLANWGAGC